MMNREITVKEVEDTLNECEDIDEPIIVKRRNKSDVVILSLQEYKDKLADMEIIKHLKRSEEDIEEGRTIPAEEVFRELRDKYGY